MLTQRSFQDVAGRRADPAHQGLGDGSNQTSGPSRVRNPNPGSDNLGTDAGVAGTPNNRQTPVQAVRITTTPIHPSIERKDLPARSVQQQPSNRSSGIFICSYSGTCVVRVSLQSAR